MVDSPPTQQSDTDLVDSPPIEQSDTDLAPAALGSPFAESLPSQVGSLQIPLQPLGFADRYVSVSTLGKGGMGEVVLTRDNQIGRNVATKLLLSYLARNPYYQSRFVREARIQGQLEHPSIVPVYDLGVEPGGLVYFTMKRIRGVSLEQIIVGLRRDREGFVDKYTRRRLLTGFAQACLAVDFAHEHGVIHRDLKPGNIMLGEFGEVYVLDWGLAKTGSGDPDLEGDEATPYLEIPEGAPTTVGAVVGTAGYMSPEQVRADAHNIGPVSDVYALGCILFELLTRRRLHPSRPGGNLATSTLRGANARASVRAPEAEVPPELEEICIKATQLDPPDRYPSARDLHDALERYLGGERDVELRRDMARQHAATAAAEAERACTEDTETFDHRRQAMREIGRALALDPANERAMGTMVQLLAEPPHAMPPEVRGEIRRSTSNQLRRVGKFATVAYLSLFLYLPLFLWSGIRDPWGVVLFYALVIVTMALSAWTAFRRPRISILLSVMIASNLAFASASFLFGPLILVPTLLAVNTAAFGAQLEPRFRGVAIASAVVTLLAAVGVELSGLVGTSYRFDDGAMSIVPRAVELPYGPTMLFLTITGVAAVITGAASVGHIRDALTDAERRLYLYAWHLREIIPEAGRESTDSVVAGRSTSKP